jgi:hypothetical protein
MKLTTEAQGHGEENKIPNGRFEISNLKFEIVLLRASVLIIPLGH